MSTFLASSGRLARGSFALRFVLSVVIWAGLIYGMLHYVGKVWPMAYQVHHAIALEAEAKAISAGAPGKPAEAATASAHTAAPVATPAATTAASPAPVTAATAVTPATANAPATPTPAAGTPATAAPAPKPGINEPLPHDHRLSGFDRHAFGNVAIFYSIVISILAAGVVLNHVIKRLRDAGWHGYWSLAMLIPGVMIAATYVLHRRTFEMTPVTPLQWLWGLFMVVCAALIVVVLFVLFFKPSASASTHDEDGHGHAHAH